MLVDNPASDCKNCEKTFEENFEFCPYCGQKTKDDLTIGLLFYNTISNYFSFDARFFKSFIPLMIRPGYLAKRFVEGKRLLFLHPAQFYLFISIVFFFLFSFIARKQQLEFDKSMKKEFENVKATDSININSLDSISLAKITDQIKNTKGIPIDVKEKELKELDSIIALNVNKQNIPLGLDFTKKLDSLIAMDAPIEEQLKSLGMEEGAGTFKRKAFTQLLKLYKQRGGGVIQAFYDSIPIAMFILLPIFAFILKLFFFRRGQFAHHLVFSFYYFSFLFTVFSIIILVNFIWEIPDWIDWLVVFSTFFYLFLAIKNYYRQGYVLSFFKSGIVSFVYLSFVIPIAFLVMVAAALMFY